MMNKKFITGMLLFIVGMVLGGFGIHTTLQSMGAGLLYVNSWYGQLLNGWVYMLTGPVILLIGAVLALIGYFVACKNFVVPERKPRVKKEKAPKPVRAAAATPVAPSAPAAPVAPVATPAAEEKTVFVSNAPLDTTQISYTFCGKCGKRNKTGVKFCAGCGEKL